MHFLPTACQIDVTSNHEHDVLAGNRARVSYSRSIHRILSMASVANVLARLSIVHKVSVVYSLPRCEAFPEVL